MFPCRQLYLQSPPRPQGARLPSPDRTCKRNCDPRESRFTGGSSGARSTSAAATCLAFSLVAPQSRSRFSTPLSGAATTPLHRRIQNLFTARWANEHQKRGCGVRTRKIHTETRPLARYTCASIGCQIEARIGSDQRNETDPADSTWKASG